MKDMQVVILCGGQGTRIRAVAEDKPKPMVDVGGKPILWHIMKTYSAFGVRRFVLALGHQGEKIIDYFSQYQRHSCDHTLYLNGASDTKFYNTSTDVEDWEITMVHTGADTMTGGRIKRVLPYIDQELFFATYGDGVSDVDINQLYEFHKNNQVLATLTGVHLPTTFGIVDANEEGRIMSFREKPTLDGYINGGFFVFNKEIESFIEGDSTILEEKPFRSLIRQQQLAMFRHNGFWQCMDHYKDYTTLNKMWSSKNAPWHIW
jgi:glucose-1-phosphate cytidylyltransferase